ncbi:hypothetical protein B0H14DRAFT_1652234, partial [Mycena olivaceomarginata]
MISKILLGTPLFATGSEHMLKGPSEHQVQRVCEYLRDWIAQLRNLPSPFTGPMGGSLLPKVAHRRRPRWAFHLYYRFTRTRIPNPLPSDLASNPHLAHLVSAREHKSYSINLALGDLLLHNILADSLLRPTGIVDWECASWMPEYWETVSSLRGHWAYMCVGRIFGERHSRSMRR